MRVLGFLHLRFSTYSAVAGVVLFPVGMTLATEHPPAARKLLLLYRTRILTVGSLYHRNAAAYMRLRDAWRAEPGDTEPEAVRATRARFLLACKGSPRLGLVSDFAEHNTSGRINRWKATSLVDSRGRGWPVGLCALSGEAMTTG
jgi:hypothetical protein